MRVYNDGKSQRIIPDDIEKNTLFEVRFVNGHSILPDGYCYIAPVDNFSGNKDFFKWANNK
jgi:hypothetical protein